MAASRRSIEAAKVPGAPLRPLLRCPAATVSGVLSSPVREVGVAGALGALSPFSRLFSALLGSLLFFLFLLPVLLHSSLYLRQRPVPRPHGLRGGVATAVSAATLARGPFACCKAGRGFGRVFGGGFRCRRLVLHGHLLLTRVGLAAERHLDLCLGGAARRCCGCCRQRLYAAIAGRRHGVGGRSCGKVSGRRRRRLRSRPPSSRVRWRVGWRRKRRRLRRNSQVLAVVREDQNQPPSWT